MVAQVSLTSHASAWDGAGWICWISILPDFDYMYVAAWASVFHKHVLLISNNRILCKI